MRQWYSLGGALCIKYIPTIPAMMFPVREAESRSTTQADVRVYPLRRLNTCKWWNLRNLTDQLTALLSNILLAMSVLGGNRKPSRCNVRYISPM